MTYFRSKGHVGVLTLSRSSVTIKGGRNQSQRLPAAHPSSRWTREAFRPAVSTCDSRHLSEELDETASNT